MNLTAHTRSPRRSLFGPLAVLAPTALLLALIIPAYAITPSHASPQQGAAQSLTVKASSFHLPKQFTTGTLSFTLVNDTKSEVDASIGQGTPGSTQAQIKAASDAMDAQQGSPSAFSNLIKVVTLLGGPDVPAGATSTAVFTLDKPGLYAMHVGSDSGPGHLYFFTVTGKSVNAALPPAGLDITLKEMKFLGFPKQVTAGTVTLHLTNTGDQVHEMGLARLDSGKTQKDVLKVLESPQGQNGPPPAWVHFFGGLDTLSPQQSLNLTLTLTPGTYVAMCFMPDTAKKDQPHVMEGMITSFTVK